MPKLIQETQVLLQRSDLDRRTPITRPQSRPRSSGVHLSGVLKYIAQTTNMVKAVAELEQDELPLNWALGLAWEEFAVSLYDGVTWQPGEVRVNDVYMTCDGICIPLNTDPVRLEEFKFTSKKVKHGSDFLADWLWMQQGRAYCQGYGVSHIRWHVCYYRGHYFDKGQSGLPEYWRYLVEFTDEEIASTWRMIQANKERATPEEYQR